MAKESRFCQLWLTVANTVEADTIVKTLLEKQLIACVRQFSVDSDYRWQGTIERANEIMIIMESKVDLFQKIEKEIAKLHGYETFVLLATPISKLNEPAAKWLDEEIA